MLPRAHTVCVCVCVCVCVYTPAGATRTYVLTRMHQTCGSEHVHMCILTRTRSSTCMQAYMQSPLRTLLSCAHTRPPSPPALAQHTRSNARSHNHTLALHTPAGAQRERLLRRRRICYLRPWGSRLQPQDLASLGSRQALGVPCPVCVCARVCVCECVFRRATCTRGTHICATRAHACRSAPLHACGSSHGYTGGTPPRIPPSPW